MIINIKFYKERTLAAYEKNFSYYENLFRENMKKKREEFEIFTKYMQGKKILDVGSGTGEQALILKSKGYKVTCIDISPEMVRSCREKGLKAYVADMETMRLKNNSYDGIWMLSSLHHIAKINAPKVINKISKGLKSGGVLFLCARSGRGEKFVKKHGKERFFSFWKLAELKEMLQDLYKIQHARISRVRAVKYVELYARKL